MKTLTFLIILSFSFNFANIYGQAPGSLDLSFNNLGYRVDTLGNGEDYYADIFTLPDNRLLVSASVTSDPTEVYPYFLLKRLLATGETDPTFAQAIGVVSSYLGGSEAGKINVQPDGKIVVAGTTFFSPYHYAILARFNPNGALDTTFSPGGTVSGSGSAAFNFINVEGGSNIFWPTIRPMPLDIKFDENNNIFFCGNATRSHPTEGDVVLTGYIAKSNNVGSLDTSFSGNGLKIMRIHEQLYPDSAISDFNTTVEQIHVLENGKILAIGQFSEYFQQSTPFGYLARLNPDGTFDPSFANNGILVIDDCQFSGYGYQLIERMLVDQNGSITLIGNLGDGNVCRVLPNGEFDSSFGSNGRIRVNIDNSGPVIAFEELDNGKYVVATSRSIKRFNSDFSIDYSFRNHTFQSQNIPMGSTPNFFSGSITNEAGILLVGSNNAGLIAGIKNSLLVKIDGSECTLAPVDQPSDVYGNIGSSVTISLSIPDAINYTWQVQTPSAACSASPFYWFTLGNFAPYSGSTTSELTISNLTQALDGKIYRCIIQTNDCGGLSEEITLHIGEEPNALERIASNRISANPNPAGEYIRISSNTNQELNENYQIIDLNGKIVQTGRIKGISQEMNLSVLDKGFYRIQLENGGGINFIHE